MLRKITYNAVNWVDGMKITREHFLHLENNLYDYIRDANAIRLNAFNYGLLPPHPESHGESLKLNLVIDRNGLLKVDLFECRAITPAGTRIEIGSTGAFTEQKSLSKEINLNELGSTNFYVVVSSNPFDRVPVGDPDPAENPPRFPFAIPSCNIEVVPVENYNKMTSGPFHVAIAKIKYTNTRVFVKDEDYIPPTANIKSSQELLDVHGSLDTFLCQLEGFTVEIVKKIYKKEQTNEIAKSVLYLCEEVMYFLGSHISNFRWVVVEMEPVHMIEFFMRFARVIKNTIDVKEGTGREQMITYFKEWIVEVNQGEFDAVVENMMNCEYQHADINQNILLIQVFTKTITKVFEELNKLDYIGDKKKGKEMTVKTTNVAANINTPKKRSFLVD
jgi:hypothetical protein